MDASLCIYGLAGFLATVVALCGMGMPPVAAVCEGDLVMSHEDLLHIYEV